MDSPLDISLGARIGAYLFTASDLRKQRKRINKKLIKLRHDLDLITKDTKNYSAKQKITSISSENYDSDSRYGLLLLLTAERDILYSLELKSLLELSNEKTASYKNLMATKIRRSLYHCQHLLQVVQNEADDTKHLEIYIYTALIQGQLSIFKKKWTSALTSYSIAKCALDYLYSTYNDEDNEGESYAKSLIAQITENFVDPSLQLAIDQGEFHESTTDLKSISRKHCHDKNLPYLSKAVQIIEKHDASFVTDLSSTVDLIKSITWRNHEAVLYNEEIAYKIMKLRDSDWTHLEDFDELIIGWNEVLEIHKLDNEKHQDEDDLENVQNRAITMTYINYNAIFSKIKRDLLLIDNLTKEKGDHNKDKIRLYSSILAQVGEVMELPGVYNDDELSESLVNLEKYFTALKEMSLGDAFKLNNQHSEALKIHHHVEKNLPIEDKVFQVDFPYDIVNNDTFHKFKAEVSSKVVQTRCAAQFGRQRDQNAFAVETVDKFPVSISNIVNISKVPKILPILSKPVLFDIAYNYLRYDAGKSSSAAAPAPAQSTDSSSAANAEDSNKKRGFFGIFGGR